MSGNLLYSMEEGRHVVLMNVQSTQLFDISFGVKPVEVEAMHWRTTRHHKKQINIVESNSNTLLTKKKQTNFKIATKDIHNCKKQNV